MGCSSIVVGHDPEVTARGEWSGCQEEARSTDPLGDVARSGADSTGIRGATDVVGVGVGAVEVHKGSGGGPEVKGVFMGVGHEVTWRPSSSL